MRIAIIGAGISGNVAAYLLSQSAEIVVYEREDRLGGHSATVDISYDGAPISVDTGFIVYNMGNYPVLCAMFDHLGVKTEASDMSFSVSLEKGAFEWCGDSLDSIFADRGNITSLSFWRMLAGILRFNSRALADLAADTVPDLSLGDYLKAIGVSDAVRDRYIVPMGAAIWSTPAAEMLAFPARSFLNFFNNHRLLHLRKPDWRTVSGGSRQYVEKLTTDFSSRIRKGCAAIKVNRLDTHVEVTDETGRTSRFDHVILACHSDQALALLEDASSEEREALAAIRYRPNNVYLHRDERLMPSRRKCWAAWNYMTANENGEVVVSYWMNKLQNLPKERPLFITLNPAEPPAPELTFGHYIYDHPQYDRPAIAAQQTIQRLQGQRNTWFAGAWLGYGFHEDGARSGLEVAERLGARIPWTAGKARETA